MVYYRSMRGFRAAISRKIKIFSMQRVHEYTVRTAYSKSGEGLNITTIRVMQLSELDGPIPPEFLTTNN